VVTFFPSLRVSPEHDPPGRRISDSFASFARKDTSEEFNPRYMAHPARMDRKALIFQILRYAARHGVFPGYSEDQVAARAERLDEPQLRAWAEEVARSFPWPFDFEVPTFAEFMHSDQWLRHDFQLSERQEWALNASLGPDAWHWFVRPRRVSKVVLCWGKGSGKDLESAGIAAYASGMVAYMRNPWFHFRMPTGEVLDVLNVAESEEQARDVYFEKLKRNLEQPCYEPLLNQKKHIHADDVEFWRPVPGDAYPRLCIRIRSSHSHTSSTEGKNTFLAVLDEVDAMRTKMGGPKNARDIYNSLRTSSRFGPWQIMVLLSWPRDQEGFIMEMLKQAGNLNPAGAPEIWGDKAATWEVLSHKVFIPGRWQGNYFVDLTHEKFDIADPNVLWTNPARTAFLTSGERDSEMAQAYRDDKEVFNATYAAMPPAAEGAYFSMPTKLDECEADWLFPVAEVTPSTTIDVVRKNGTPFEYRYVALQVQNIRLRYGITYYLGGDAGTTEDSFALSLMHAIPPGEHGNICTTCWNTWSRRFAKHYAPFPLPEAYLPAEYPCDHCGRRPEPGKDRYWGHCEASGQMVERPKPRLGPDGRALHTQSGEPLYEQRPGPDGQPVTVMEEVWQPMVVEDLLLVWKPDRGTGRPVDFRNVRDTVLKIGSAALAAGGQLGGAWFDKWNAEQMIQEIREAGIPCEAKTFSNPEQFKMYGNLKSLVNANSMFFLPRSVVGELPQYELKRIQLINLNRIDHPQGGSKDTADARCLAALQCCQAASQVGSIDLGVNPAQSAVYTGMEEQALRDLGRDEPELGIVEQVLATPGLSVPLDNVPGQSRIY
jgi:hypothetical protein